jgi:hypothetical protein
MKISEKIFQTGFKVVLTILNCTPNVTDLRYKTSNMSSNGKLFKLTRTDLHCDNIFIKIHTHHDIVQTKTSLLSTTITSV